MRSRRLALALIATAQFVLVLDITIVTIALPTIQRELGFEQAELQWLITGYAVTFGGFLLLAGRAADLFGRRRVFVGGILLFWCRVVSPAALALLTTTFERGPGVRLATRRGSMPQQPGVLAPSGGG